MKHLLKYIICRLKFAGRLSFAYNSNISLSCKFEGCNKIYPNSIFSGNMGYGSYIGPNCDIAANIGRFTSIAPYVKTNRGTHPFLPPFATTCPMFFSLRRQNGHTFAKKLMYDERLDIPEIGNDCWIGENVFIAGGVKISDGAVVLAGAVVTKDVPPYAIVGGVPAKVIKYRYDEETIDSLLGFKWWNKSLSWLEANWSLLCDIEQLKKHVISEK